MELLCYCIGAALLVLTGAVISGGLTLPAPPWREDGRGRSGDAPDAAGGRAQPRPRRADGLRTRGG